MGNCKYCGDKAGFLRSKHGMCEVNYREGLRDMRALASRAAASTGFNQATLYESLSAIAQRSWAGESDIQAAIVAGWNQAVSESLADGVLTHDEETRLREFRDGLALTREDTRASDARLEVAFRDRLMLDARLAALAVSDAKTHLHELSQMLEGSGLSPGDQRSLLVQAWETAVEGTLEDGMLTLDEEAALVRYLHHFDLSAREADSNGAHRNMIEAAVIREAAEGLVPSRLDPNIQTPFNLMKSEELVWVFDGAKYIETRTRRERRGTSHGLSIRVARGLYYRPSSFRSQAVEWEETAHVDTGVLGVTTKHIYFHGPRKRFRVRYDKIVSFEPYTDGIGIMRDAQTAKPQSFATGDGWFIYNLVTNLARR